MKQYFLSALKFLVFLALGAFLIWLAVKNLTDDDKTQIAKALSEANYWWVILAMFIGLVAHLSRAIRWRMLLAPMNLTPKLSTIFYAVIIGYMGNLAFPRLGEVLRCGILNRYEKIPIPQSLGTVITERIIDVLILLLLFVVSIWVEYDHLENYIKENMISTLKLKMLSLAENKMMLFFLIAAFSAMLVSVFVFRKKIFQNPVVQKVKGVLLGFWDGIRSVQKVKNPGLFVFHSFFIWVMYLMSLYVCVFTFHETKTMTPVNCLVLMTFASFGVVATPGGIGAYQWIVLQIMLLWGYSTAIGVAFGWVVWLAQTVIILCVGLLSFVLLALGSKEIVTTSNP